MKLASCVGNQFDLQTLATALEQSSLRIPFYLWNALQEGLIVLDEGTGSLPPAVERSPVTDWNSCPKPNPVYRFLNSLLHQTTYALLEEKQRKENHLRLGRLMLQGGSSIERYQRVFDIVHHLNQASDLVSEPAEIQKLVQHNLLAGKRDKASTAYASALKYFQKALSFLNEKHWQVQYERLL